MTSGLYEYEAVDLGRWCVYAVGDPNGQEDNVGARSRGPPNSYRNLDSRKVASPTEKDLANSEAIAAVIETVKTRYRMVRAHIGSSVVSARCFGRCGGGCAYWTARVFIAFCC